MKKVRINETQLHKVVELTITEDTTFSPTEESNDPQTKFLAFFKNQITNFPWFNIAGEVYEHFSMYDVDEREPIYYSFNEKIEEYFIEKFFDFVINNIDKNPDFKAFYDEYDFIASNYDELLTIFKNALYGKEKDIVQAWNEMKQEDDKEEDHMNHLRNNSYKW